MEAEITNFKEYYDNKIVTAMIGIEADINMVEDIGEKLPKIRTLRRSWLLQEIMTCSSR